MKKATRVVQVIFGLLLLLFGSMNLLGFAPPTQFSAPAQTFMTALVETGYMMPIVNLVQVVVGVSMVTNRFVTLGLIIFAPITVNILLFHVFLDMASILPALITTILHGYLIFTNFEHFRPFIQARGSQKND